MRELTDDFKLSVRSCGEVNEALNGMVSRNKTTGAVQYRDKPLTREALVNAGLLYLHSLSEPERVQALRAGVARLEAILGGEPLPASVHGPVKTALPKGADWANVDPNSEIAKALQQARKRRALPPATDLGPGFDLEDVKPAAPEPNPKPKPKPKKKRG